MSINYIANSFMVDAAHSAINTMADMREFFRLAWYNPASFDNAAIDRLAWYVEAEEGGLDVDLDRIGAEQTFRAFVALQSAAGDCHEALRGDAGLRRLWVQAVNLLWREFYAGIPGAYVAGSFYGIDEWVSQACGLRAGLLMYVRPQGVDTVVPDNDRYAADGLFVG